MITFELGPFWLAMEDLKRAVQLASILHNQGDNVVAENNHSLFENHFKEILPIIRNMRLDSAFTACWKLDHLLKRYRYKRYTPNEIKLALERLIEDISLEMKQEVFFHYRRDLADLLRSIPAVWEDVICAFPSSRHEIEAGIDCFALGDYPGSIFHMLRIAEVGLRAIAKERNVKTVRGSKPIEYAMWGEVIAALRDAIDMIRTAKGNKRPLTAKRRAYREIAVEFYSTIMGDMQALLPLRDRTVHLRDAYDKGEA